MSNTGEFARLFQREIRKPLLENVGLSPFSSFKIGGPADLFFEATSEEDLAGGVRLARRTGFSFCVIGGGYNVLFDDDGFRGLLIRNRAVGIRPGGNPGEIQVSSGTPLGDVVRYAEERGLEGLEFMAGIPGTAGGAVAGNAGAFGRAAGDIVKDAVLLNRQGLETKAGPEDLGFGYRSSALRGRGDILLRAVLALAPGDRDAIRSRIEENLGKRRCKHPPLGTACAGSYFKNPILPGGEKTAAGRLLELAGAKGMRVGGAAVWEGHCNFIINLGNASARDVLALAGELRKRVQEKFGVSLEDEVIYLPAASSAA